MPTILDSKGKELYESLANKLRKNSLLKVFVPEKYGEAISDSSMLMPAAYKLSTSPYINKITGDKSLYVSMLHSDSPHESVRILRDLLGRAEREGAKDILFTPVSGSSKGTTPMRDMITTFMNRRNIDVPAWGPSNIDVNELRKLVKRPEMPPVSQEANDLLGEKVMEIYKKYSTHGEYFHDFDAINELKKYVEEVHPEFDWQKSYDTALELFNLGQAKGALNYIK